MWEPVYLNLWELTVTPPAAISNWNPISLENIKKISGLDVNQVPGTAEQIFRGAKRSFAGALPEKTTVDIVTSWEVNVDDNLSMFVYQSIKNWCDLVWSPLTGTMQLKKDYTGGPMIITLQNRVQSPIRRWTFPTVFPTTNIKAMDLDFANGTTLYDMDMTFRADYWGDESQ